MSERVSSPSLPWKTKIYLHILTAVIDASRRANVTVNRRLLNFFDIRLPPKGKPVKGVKTADITVDPTRNLWFRIFTPTECNRNRLPVIVFFHGGAFSFLSAASKAYDKVCRRIARKIPAVIVSVNYRLSPENRYPVQYEDGIDVVRYLDNSTDLDTFAPGIDVSRCFLAGDSAGGNVAHHVARRISDMPRSEFRVVRVIGLVAIQPFFGGEERTPAELRLVGMPLVSVERTDWAWKAFLPEGSDRDHEAVNVSGPRSADISGSDFPTTLVFVTGFDPLQDWQKRYFDWLRKSGKEAYLVEYPGTIHVFYLFPELPESSLLITEMRDFVMKQSSKVQKVGRGSHFLQP
ncbi:putative carboxylesterase 18 [Tasmannia lanceolata]|uniref:putative carboxylesterase 18 n=1 Tax=Tasmannia lanceolata TaxID=3420 RepID=UPI004064B402